MPVDMKELIAGSALKILMKGNVRKLTVKDIVDECNITRQTFYYHFNDIPQMFEWILNKHLDSIFASYSGHDIESGIRVFFLAAANTAPYFIKGARSGYGDELDRLLPQAVYNMFDRIVEREGFYSDYPVKDLAIIKRYHCHAVMGLLKDWVESDMEDLDHVSHVVYLLVSGQIKL